MGEQSIDGRPVLENSKAGSLVGEIALFYGSDSLTRQITKWARKHPACTIRCSFAKVLPEIRLVLETADGALIDATDDDAQAVDAFSQAAGHLGTNAVAIYSEVMHEGVELLVRSRGSQVLLGPLGETQWDGFFQQALQGGRGRSGRKAA
jgi:hypothetical protein